MTDDKIRKLLHDDGIQCHREGFEVLLVAIKTFEPGVKFMYLYKTVGAKTNRNGSAVERCIRTAMKNAKIDMHVSEYIATMYYKANDLL